MIADLAFGRRDGQGVRRARFVPRVSIPLSAACVVASGLRETLRELFGAACEVTLGEPVALAAAAWTALTHEALCFVTRGRQTDIVLVLPARDACTLVRRAFGEATEGAGSACSTLELAAVERIAARCAAAFDALCAERLGPARPVAAGAVPPCVAYFDVRVSAPVELTLGIGIVRDLPDPGPSGALPRAALSAVPLEVRAQFAAGTIDAQTLLRLNVGDVVPLATKVGAPAVLKVADHTIAGGACGQFASRHAFLVHAVPAGGVGP